MHQLAIVWGGTQITTLRVVLAVLAEVLIFAYIVLVLRLFGR